MTEQCALAWNYKMSFKDLWSRQQNWSQWSFFKRISVNAFFFSYSETEKLVGVFFPHETLLCYWKTVLAYWKILYVNTGRNIQGVWFSYCIIVMQPCYFCSTTLRNQAHQEVMMCSGEWFAVGCVQPEAGCSTSPVSSHAAACSHTSAWAAPVETGSKTLCSIFHRLHRSWLHCWHFPVHRRWNLFP